MKSSDSPNVRRFPAAMRLGFGLLAVGLVLDLAYHAVLALGGGGAASHSGAFPDSVHAVVLAGMAVTFAGVLQVAFKPERIVKRKESQ